MYMYLLCDKADPEEPFYISGNGNMTISINPLYNA